MPILPYKGIWPKIAEDVFVAEGAVVIGDVTIGEGSSIWYNVVVRGDTSPIVIGRNTNIQDNAVIHGQHGRASIIGDNCTMGHLAIVHGATVEDGSLVGIGAIVMAHAIVGTGSIVGPGAVVTERQVIPPHSLAVGVPAKVVKTLAGEAANAPLRTSESYARNAKVHRARQTAQEAPPPTPPGADVLGPTEPSK